MSAFGVRTVYHQANSVGSLQMRLHPATIVFKYESGHTLVVKHIESHGSVQIRGEHSENNYFFRHIEATCATLDFARASFPGQS
jgi:hypothetical protein